MLERIKKQGVEKAKKDVETLHEHYAKKLQQMISENDETLLKLQKDFIRDIVEELKNVASDIRYAMGAANEDDDGIQDAIK
jgi:DNA-binding ferritin-like protein